MFGDYLYALIIYPIEIFIETVFTVSMKMIPNAGYAIVFVSIAVQLLALPMYKRADEIQEEERNKQKGLSKWIEHIKKTFKGDEQLMMLSEYYRQNDYQPWYSLKGLLPLALQIPFFIAAYHFLSNCTTLNGASFYFLKDMGRPDGMLNIGGIPINIMPILMTAINIVSGMIYTKGLKLKDKLQLYLTAGVFLILLYSSPSGLVFYWTLNNVFSLLKNIFMKIIKHPRPIIAIASVLFSVVYSYKCYTYGVWPTESGKIVIITILVIGLVPAMGMLINLNNKDKTDTSIAGREDRTVFLVSCITSAVVLGIMIPAGAMSTSPEEFVIKGHYESPLVQVLYTFVVACGIFVLWGNLIYGFSSACVKKILTTTMMVCPICGIINYMFFSYNLNNMSIHMQYYITFDYGIKEKLINLAVILTVSFGLLGLYLFRRKFVLFSCYIVLAAASVMSFVNVFTVQSIINNTPHVKDDDYYINSDTHFTLDRDGNNVVVIMLDRAFGQLIPFFFNEKPELGGSYSGFTYYPNTISYGMNTITGAPVLYGGYDYTPYNRLGKDDSYRNESVKVLPKLFSSNGFVSTVLDVPFGLDDGDKGIEQFYNEVDPSIQTYYADGVMKTKEEAQRDYEYFVYAARKNYIRHSFFISSPLIVRLFLYDNDDYLMQETVDDRITYAGHKEALDKLPEMTKISSEGVDTFTIMVNNATHSQKVELQMPDYSLVENADNSPYLPEWEEKLNAEAGERGINMYSRLAKESYAVGMSSMMSVGKWLDYLRENDLYDNTRIILVADHGYYFYYFDDMIFDRDGVEADLEMFEPLLMVKDYNDREFKISDDFMTNGDVATLACEGLINDPINPYTGNPINSDQKYERPQYINNLGCWFSVHDDIYNIDNWDLIDIDMVDQ